VGGLSRSTMRRIASGGILLAAAGFITSAGAANAAPANIGSQPVYWVSLSGAAGGANTSCQTAAYGTVQSAVNAAEAYEGTHAGAVPAIDICPGTYSEQVTILDSLALTRAPVAPDLGPVTIELPAAVGNDQSSGLSSTNCQADDAAAGTSKPQSVIEICAAGPDGANTTGVQVTASDLTVEGNWPNNVCYDSLYGILVGGGASLSLSDSTVERIGAYPLNGCQGGVGIEAGYAPTGQIGHAKLTDDTVETYQKNGITIDGPGSTADIDDIVVAGSGPTSQIAQNGIQVSYGATASVTRSSITGNNYTGLNFASSAGILLFGGGGSVCGVGPSSQLVKHATFTFNKLVGNDIGIYMGNYNAACTAAADTPTMNTACSNVIENNNGYPGGHPSADANLSGFSTNPDVGYQAGVQDTGDRDAICDNIISGAGYAPRDATSSLPNPPPPAFVRPIDLVSVPPIDAISYDNTYDGVLYDPS
jgi:hypothetical protein